MDNIKLEVYTSFDRWEGSMVCKVLHKCVLSLVREKGDYGMQCHVRVNPVTAPRVYAKEYAQLLLCS